MSAKKAPVSIKNVQKFSNENQSPENHTTHLEATSNVHFLDFGTQTPKKGNETNFNTVENQAEHIADIENMTATELKEKYKLTYDSWKNMKSRCKAGYVLSPEFVMFKDFLRYMGPRVSKELTLDRIDFNNRNYSPENCRWADKATQNQNKGNNVYLTHMGETHTVSAWAKKLGLKADVLYRRKKIGWSDEEIITGKKKVLTSPANSLWQGTPWPKGKEEVFEKSYLQDHHSDETRLEYLYRKSKFYYEELKQFLSNNFDPNDPDDHMSPEQEARLTMWKSLHEKSRHELEMQRKRRAFINRSGGLGKSMESKIYDHLHGTPIIYKDDPK